MDHSDKVGRYVLREMGSVAHLHKKNLEKAGFVVLKSPSIPSILIETGFISNPGEEKKLKTAAYRRKLAQAIGRGVVTYFNQYPPPDSYVAKRQQYKNIKQHTVARGDTLSKIANRYQVSMVSLMSANALSRADVIRTGQKIRIP